MQTEWPQPRVHQYAAIIHIQHHHLLLLLSPKADTHFTTPWTVQGSVNPGTALRVCSPCSRLYTAVSVVINTTAVENLGTLNHSQSCYHFTTTRPLQPAKAHMCKQLTVRSPATSCTRDHRVTSPMP